MFIRIKEENKYNLKLERKQYLPSSEAFLNGGKRRLIFLKSLISIKKQSIRQRLDKVVS